MTRHFWQAQAMMKYFWPAIIIVSCLVVGFVTFLDIQSPLRAVAAFWFLLICPGMALVRLLHIEELLVELTLAIALSLSLDAVVSSVLVYTRTWSSDLSLALLIAISIGGVAFQFVTNYRRRPNLT